MRACLQGTTKIQPPFCSSVMKGCYQGLSLARTQLGLVWEQWHHPQSQHSPQECSQCRAGSLGLINAYTRWLVVVYRFLFVLMAGGKIPSREERSHSLLHFPDHCGDYTVLILAWRNQSLTFLFQTEVWRGDVTWLRPDHLLKWQNQD